MKRIQKFYDLDVIISVGYRVKSKRGTAFRIWARSGSRGDIPVPTVSFDSQERYCGIVEAWLA